MTIRFRYQYRDGSNNKRSGQVFLNEGTIIVEEACQRIQEALDEGDYFIASQIGVPDVFLWDPSVLKTSGRTMSDSSISYPIVEGIDHCWHEWTGLEFSYQPATDQRTLDEFVIAIEAAAKEGWKDFSVGDLVKQ